MDRLTAFLDTFKLTASVAESPVQLAGPCLLLVGTDTQRGGRVLLRVQGAGELPPGLRLAVAIEFDNATNPLMAAMPDEVSASLQDGPSLRSTAQALLCEATGDRCGRAGTLNRLAEVMVLREAMEAGASWPGIFAALAHPGLYQAVVSMHDLPARAWTVEDLAALATMSRTHFMTTFHKVAGTTPMAYLTAWRLTLARRHLQAGDAVKSVSRRVGFGSAAAFSRAFSPAYGQPPASYRLCDAGMRN